MGWVNGQWRKECPRKKTYHILSEKGKTYIKQLRDFNKSEKCGYTVSILGTLRAWSMEEANKLLAELLPPVKTKLPPIAGSIEQRIYG